MNFAHPSRRAVGAVVLATLLAVHSTSPRRAAADDDDKVRCARAYEQAQRTRKAGKLRESEAQLSICVASSCPAVLRDECVTWLAEVDATLPTVVFSVKTKRGVDLLDVTVLVDGEPLLTRLDGKAHAVDPGSHVFRFEHEGSAPIERRVLIREGEKLRPIDVSIAANEGEPSAPDSKDDDAKTHVDRPVPASVYLFGAIAVLGFGGFAYFGISGLSKKSELDGCKPACDPSDVDSAKRTFRTGDVFLGVGAVSLGLASVFYFTRSSSSATSSTSSVRLGPMSGGVGGAFSMSF